MKINKGQTLSLVLAIIGGAISGAAGHIANNYMVQQSTEKTIRKMAKEGLPINVKNIEEV